MTILIEENPWCHGTGTKERAKFNCAHFRCSAVNSTRACKWNIQPATGAYLQRSLIHLHISLEILFISSVPSRRAPLYEARTFSVRTPRHIWMIPHTPFEMTSAPDLDSQSFRLAPSATLVCRLRMQFSILTLLRDNISEPKGLFMNQ